VFNHQGYKSSINRRTYQEAGDRLAKIQLSRISPNNSNLEIVQELSDGRANAYQVLDDSCERDHPKVIATASQDLKRVEQTAKARRARRHRMRQRRKADGRESQLRVESASSPAIFAHEAVVGHNRTVTGPSRFLHSRR
jgi:hypothetical protein